VQKWKGENGEDYRVRSADYRFEKHGMKKGAGDRESGVYMKA
jgi:hypothetical protein